MNATDDLLTRNAAYAASFERRDTRPDVAPPAGPTIAVVACMDARMDVYGLLGLHEGEAHVIRNAGGLITEAEIRSLAISQRLLGTREIVLIHHTDCGMTKFRDGEFVAALKAELGVEPDWVPGAISDIDASVRASIAAIQASPFIPRKDAIRGFVYDVGTGVLREVSSVSS